MAWDLARLGSQDNTNNLQELFKVEYGLQVMRNFKKALQFSDATKVKKISNSRGYEWPLLTDVDAKVHKPGERIGVSNPKRGTRTIYADDTLYSAIQVDEWEKLANHTDEVSMYTEIQGKKLAELYDLIVATEVINGALIAPSSDPLVATTNIGKGGNYVEAKITGAVDGSGNPAEATSLLAAILEMGEALDKKDVPRAGRTLVLKPDYYWILFNNIDLLNTLHPGIGSIAEGEIMRIAGFKIKMSNNFPTGNSLGIKYDDGTTAALSNHDIPAAKRIAPDVKLGGVTIEQYGLTDVSKLAGIVYIPGAVGTVRMKGLTVSIKNHDDYFADLISTRMITGHGWLNPAGCGILIDNAGASIIATA